MNVRCILIEEMLDYIEKNNIIYFCDLCDYAIKYKMNWFKVLCDDCTFIVDYLDNRNEIKG